MKYKCSIEWHPELEEEITHNTASEAAAAYICRLEQRLSTFAVGLGEETKCVLVHHHKDGGEYVSDGIYEVSGETLPHYKAKRISTCTS